MRAVIASAIVAVGMVHLAAQAPSSREIEDAIAQGRAGRTLEKRCTARGVNGFDFVIDGPVGRVMRAAAEAKRKGRVFGPADVTGDMVTLGLVVTAKRVDSLSVRYEGTYLKGSAAPTVVLPDPEVLEPSRAFYTMRGNYEANIVLRGRPSASGQPSVVKALSITSTNNGDMQGHFDLDAFKALPAGNVDVVLFKSEMGERRCTISDKDRQRLR